VFLETPATKMHVQVSECHEESQIELKFESGENISIKIENTDNDPLKLPRKLSEVCASEVEEAIKKCREKFYSNNKCIKCGFVSCNTRALSVHMTHLHKDVKDHWCSICNSEVEVLSEHLLSHAEDEFKCKFCGKHFNSRGHFTEHLRSHSSVRPHKCHVCHKGFIARRHLAKHLRIHMNNRRYRCTFCSRNFSTQTTLHNHLKAHFHSKIKLESIKNLDDDEEEESEIKPLNLPQNFCKICKKRVRSLGDHFAKYHENSNQDEIKKEKDGVLCTLCGKKFNSGSRLRLHMRTHTGEAPYKCSYCDKRTTARNQMVVHERTHTGERPHKCNVCGKGFAQSSVLNTHMKIHTGRPEVCNICSKRFCRPAQLRLHMRKHTGEKPFECTECEQAFKQRSHLTEHLKTHSDERPYKCTHCDKGFKQSSSLKSHIQIHLGKKPFKCSQCPYACRQSYSLTQHMKQHSVDAPRPEKPHVCSLCQKGFSTVAMLTSHTEVAHSFLPI
jgi:KRAB domain-containing zinc finger protein